MKSVAVGPVVLAAAGIAAVLVVGIALLTGHGIRLHAWILLFVLAAVAFVVMLSGWGMSLSRGGERRK